MINQNRQFPNRNIDRSRTILNSQRRIQKWLFGGHVILQCQNIYIHTSSLEIRPETNFSPESIFLNKPGLLSALKRSSK
jgi:hypothetical protein